VKAEVMGKLYIAIYKPRYGNYKHWALFLESTESLVFEVVGEHGTFQKNTIIGSPSSSTRHEKNILVADINEQDVPELKKVVSKVNVDNETMEWNCQDYVLEVLEALKEECIIDEDDAHYQKGINLAQKKYFGPM
jgi:hypothetical protein